MISPHFPPDSSAGTHRVRLLAPHLASYGWTPTVLTVDEQDYEGRIDPELGALVPPSLEVVRTRAIPAHVTRRFGLGDLGLRALPGLGRAAWSLHRAQRGAPAPSSSSLRMRFKSSCTRLVRELSLKP